MQEYVYANQSWTFSLRNENFGMNETEARGTAFCEVVAAAVAAVAAATAAGGAGGSVSYDSSMITPCVQGTSCAYLTTVVAWGFVSFLMCCYWFTGSQIWTY